MWVSLSAPPAENLSEWRDKGQKTWLVYYRTEPAGDWLGANVTATPTCNKLTGEYELPNDAFSVIIATACGYVFAELPLSDAHGEPAKFGVRVRWEGEMKRSGYFTDRSVKVAGHLNLPDPDADGYLPAGSLVVSMRGDDSSPPDITLAVPDSFRLKWEA